MRNLDWNFTAAPVVLVDITVDGGFVNRQPASFVAVLLLFEVEVWMVPVAWIPDMSVESPLFVRFYGLEAIHTVKRRKPIE